MSFTSLHESCCSRLCAYKSMQISWSSLLRTFPINGRRHCKTLQSILELCDSIFYFWNSSPVQSLSWFRKISVSMKELQSGGNQEFVSVFGCCKEKWKCKDRAKGEWRIFLLEKALNSCLNTHLEACISKSYILKRSSSKHIKYLWRFLVVLRRNGSARLGSKKEECQISLWRKPRVFLETHI